MQVTPGAMERVLKKLKGKKLQKYLSTVRNQS